MIGLPGFTLLGRVAFVGSQTEHGSAELPAMRFDAARGGLGEVIDDHDAAWILRKGIAHGCLCAYSLQHKCRFTRGSDTFRVSEDTTGKRRFAARLNAGYVETALQRMLLGRQDIAARDEQGIDHRLHQRGVVFLQGIDERLYRVFRALCNMIAVVRPDHIRNLELGRTCDTSVPHGDVLTIRQAVGSIARQVETALALARALCLGKLVNDVLLYERCVASLEEHGARLFGDNSACQI